MKRTGYLLCCVLVISTVSLVSFQFQKVAIGQEKSNLWKPAGDKIMTRWAQKVRPESVWPEYPRPMMVRKNWKNLNGLWDYAIVSKDAEKPKNYDGKILVPFAVESALSGAGKMVTKNQNLWYHRKFNIPAQWRNKRVLLHFGAVDWESTVWVNGKEIGTHRGGYDPFYYDITDALKNSAEQEVVIRVWDPTDEDNATQPRGKQVKNPGGIFYTAVTGIWQTVWLEPVPKAHIESLKIVPDIDNNILKVTVNAKNAENHQVFITAIGEEIKSSTSGAVGKEIEIKKLDAKLWSPDSPNLYNLEVYLVDENKHNVDAVKSYFGMRKTSLCKDEKGILRLCLNNKPLFQLGPLDQGWWPDGLYTAPTDDALKYDLEITKQLGFNMLRKHVKYEPQRFYYWCDKLGLLVWQDMPSALYIRNKVDKDRLKEVDRQFDLELKQMIDNLYSHPCIVMWVAFNEGWGQHDTERIVKWIEEYDPSRLVNNASGWLDKGVGDVLDIHHYPDPRMPDSLEEKRAVVLGEFGGLALPFKGHLWREAGSWGYRSHEEQEQYAKDYTNLIMNLYPLVDKGLAAAVYTQTTDCEIEINGLMTYDREVIKLDPEKFSSLNRGYLPPKFATKQNLFIDEISVALKARDEKAEIRHTLDGSEPTETSRLYKTPIKISKDTTIKARCYWPTGEKSVVIEKKLQKAKPIAAVSSKPRDSGLKFEYYEGRWSTLPDFSKLEPAKSGVAKQMDLSCVQDDSDYGLRFTGYIKVPQTGIYSFYTNSDDGTKLFVAGKEVVTNDGVHGMKEEIGDIALETGWHSIELIFFQGYGGQGLEVSYEGPGINKRQIPAEVLGH